MLVLARDGVDARDAAGNLGLGEWYSPQAHGAEYQSGRDWSGIVYVDGWRRSQTPTRRVQGLVAEARIGGAVEVEQHDSAWFYRGDALARQAQATLAAERSARRPSTPTMVAPEVIAGHAYTIRRRWWHRITDWLQQ